MQPFLYAGNPRHNTSSGVGEIDASKAEDNYILPWGS